MLLARMADPSWEPRLCLIVCWRKLDEHLLQVHPEIPRKPISAAVTRALMVPPGKMRRRIRRGHVRDPRDLDAAAAALRVLERVFGAAPRSPASFPSRMPLLPLDRILGWPQGIVRGLEVHDTPLARIASDHLPLKARVELPAAAPLAAAA